MKIMSKCRKGATFIEYALLAGLVAIVVAAAAMMFGDKLKGLFGATGDQTQKVSEAVKEVDLLKGLNDAKGGGQQQNP